MTKMNLKLEKIDLEMRLKDLNNYVFERKIGLNPLVILTKSGLNIDETLDRWGVDDRKNFLNSHFDLHLLGYAILGAQNSKSDSFKGDLNNGFEYVKSLFKYPSAFELDNKLENEFKYSKIETGEYAFTNPVSYSEIVNLLDLTSHKFLLTKLLIAKSYGMLPFKTNNRPIYLTPHRVVEKAKLVVTQTKSFLVEDME